MPSRQPIPEPIIVPERHFSSSVEGCQLASFRACVAAAMAKTMKSSTRFDSLGSIQSSWMNAPSPSRGTGMAILQGRRSEEHTSELQSLMRISYAVFCLKKKTNYTSYHNILHNK